MTVAIVDYGSGNLKSAAKAFERVAHERGGGEAIVVTADPDVIRRADRVVLPGVGAFADCKAGLMAVDGAVDALDEAVHRRGRPFLGICVGMQLMADEGREHVVTPGLGWVPGAVVRIDAAAGGGTPLKVPHMGWNTLGFPAGAGAAGHALLDGIEAGAYVYFVHSYHFEPAEPAATLATTDYGATLVAAVVRGNLAGTQFHPEKSQAVGLRLIANFLDWRP